MSRDSKLTPETTHHLRFPRATAVLTVALAALLGTAIALLVLPCPASVPALGTLETQNLIVDQTLTHSSATPSTLTQYDASKHMTSYAGSGCGAGSGVSRLNADGSVNCDALGTGTVTSTGSAGYLSQYSTATNIQNWSGSGCGAGSAMGNLDGSGHATCVAVGTGTVTGSLTSPKLAVASGPTSLTDYSGSASPSCGAGSAVSQVTISAQGSAQVTCITAGTGTVTSTGSAGYLSQFSSATNIQNWSGSGCGVGSAIGNLDGSGHATCVATGSTSSPSISIPSPVAQTASTVNISTLGTIDWFWCPQGATSTTEPHMLKWSSSQTAIGGGFFARSFGVVNQQNWDTAAVQPITISTPGSDSWNNSANGGTNVCETWSGSAVAQDGFAWQVPASSTQQVMRLYLGGNDVAATLTCKLTVSGTTATQVHDFGSGGSNLYVVYTVTFTGGVIGDMLSCRWLVSTANTTPTAIDFSAASLGPA